MKTSTLGLPVTAIVAVLLGTILSPGQAQTTATTDPVGFVTQTLAGNADSYIYIPFKRNPDYAGATVGAVSGAGNNVITVAAGTGWTNSQFAINATTLQPRYYLLVRSGGKSGMFYTITDNTATTITLDLSGDSIAAPVVTGTTFQICAYDTLASVFPSGSGVNGSANFSQAGRQTELFIPDASTAGVNLSSSATYYYYTGVSSGGAGWRRVGSPISTIVNDQVLYPDSYFTVRHNVATATTFTTMGTVQTGQMQIPLTTIAAGQDQDIPIAVPVPATLSLAQSNLFESGAFTPSSSFSAASRQDILFVWDNAASSALNKAPDATYYYYNGTASGGAGWRLVGATISTIVNANTVIGPGKSFSIRKKNAGAVSTVFWTLTPTYAP